MPPRGSPHSGARHRLDPPGPAVVGRLLGQQVEQALERRGGTLGDHLDPAVVGVAGVARRGRARARGPGSTSGSRPPAPGRARTRSSAARRRLHRSHRARARSYGAHARPAPRARLRHSVTTSPYRCGMSTVQAHGTAAAAAPGGDTQVGDREAPARPPGAARGGWPASTGCAPWPSSRCSSSTSTRRGCPAGSSASTSSSSSPGFLITTLLVRERVTTGAIDLPGFWSRRARRLLPALLVCVPASVLLARLSEGDLLVGIGRQVVGAGHLHLELARDRCRHRLLRRHLAAAADEPLVARGRGAVLPALAAGRAGPARPHPAARGARRRRPSAWPCCRPR